MNELTIARENIANTARDLSNRAAQYQAVAALLSTMTQGAGEPLPVEELARVLLPLGLCVVHIGVVRNALAIVEQTDQTDGLSTEELRVTSERLESALKGSAT